MAEAAAGAGGGPVPPVGAAPVAQDSVEEVVTATCTLVAGSFDKFIQFLLACLSLGVLVVKRYREHPPRPMTVWLLDTSKQCFGAGIAHLANLFISIYLARRGSSDECGIYFLNFFLDTTLGVFVSYLFLQFLQKIARACGGSCTMLMRSGYYGDTPSLAVWAAQLLSWLGIIFATKLVIAVLILVAWGPLNAMAMALFSVFEHHRKVELVLVMIVAPTILNAVQFWIQDNFLADEQRLMGERLPLIKTAGGPSPRTSASGGSGAGAGTATNGSGGGGGGGGVLPLPATRRRPSTPAVALGGGNGMLSSIGIDPVQKRVD